MPAPAASSLPSALVQTRETPILYPKSIAAFYVAEKAGKLNGKNQQGISSERMAGRPGTNATLLCLKLTLHSTPSCEPLR